jgi:hypothetical protein
LLGWCFFCVYFFPVVAAVPMVVAAAVTMKAAALMMEAATLLSEKDYFLP